MIKLPTPVAYKPLPPIKLALKAGLVSEVYDAVSGRPVAGVCAINFEQVPGELPCLTVTIHIGA